ncbi:ABC transporter substrate-binding protein [Microbacterium ulmi]|uniref:ABC transporter substrate-binding protein n=1 Tax=Microbacterium ulmi TaxID=179095 RepID=A0A7Y2M072_9MICO|nr:ABC transporter substrate-binding protein [Microbacterium ulmi]NII69300.1 NitT/TauT family transport system substrate-binding protein [Microbacterium ulmi]NNH04086.1 ABC transporter substrate-binding protein [Microbacterium ulmi]
MSEKIRIEAAGAVFYLPYYVAEEEGYFADEGLDVELLRDRAFEWGPARFIEDAKFVSSFSSFNLFEAGKSDLYNACEWGQLRRSQDSQRNGKVVARRAAVASQAIIVRPDSPINVPGDLANIPVGVNFHHGSHYLALQTLEGFLARGEIKLVGIKEKNRFLALRDGDIDAVAVMEPWITVAEKQGYKIVAEAHYFGAEIANESLDADTLSRINRAVARGVDKLHEDPRPYLKYFIDSVPEDIEKLVPEDFALGRLRYVHPGPYPEDHFNRTLDWIASWGLIDAQNEFENLVDNSRALTTA